MKVEVACTVAARLRGLLGRASHEGALLLVPCNDIHTFGMRRPIDVAFVASDGAVLESYRSVRPNRRVRNKGATAVLERFASDDAWYEPGDLVQHALSLACDEDARCRACCSEEPATTFVNDEDVRSKAC